MEWMVKVAAVAIAAAVLGTVLRKSTPELALLLALCAGLWITGVAAGGLGTVVALMEELAGLSGLSEELLEPDGVEGLVSVVVPPATSLPPAVVPVTPSSTSTLVSLVLTLVLSPLTEAFSTLPSPEMETLSALESTVPMVVPLPALTTNSQPADVIYQFLPLR